MSKNQSQNPHGPYFRTFENHIVVACAERGDLRRIRTLLKDFPNDFGIVELCRTILNFEDCTTVERLMVSHLLSMPGERGMLGRCASSLPGFVPDDLRENNTPERDDVAAIDLDHLIIWVACDSNAEEAVGNFMKARVLNLEIVEEYFHESFHDYASRDIGVPSENAIGDLLARLEISAGLKAKEEENTKKSGAYVEKIKDAVDQWMQDNDISAMSHHLSIEKITPIGGISCVEIYAMPYPYPTNPI